MNDEILNLLAKNGKSAPEFTHALKVLGDGSMQQGVERLSKYYLEDLALQKSHSLRTGWVQGGIAGIVLTALTLASVAAIKHNKERQLKHAIEAEQIQDALASTESTSLNTSLSSNVPDSNSTEDAPPTENLNEISTDE